MTEKQGKAAAPKTATHTPGNWAVRTIKSSSGFYVYSDQGWPMNHIATCGNEANARLIVAACNAAMKVNPENPIAAAEALPDLLVILRRIMAAVDDGLAFIPASIGMDASSAIAKATGE